MLWSPDQDLLSSVHFSALTVINDEYRVINDAYRPEFDLEANYRDIYSSLMVEDMPHWHQFMKAINLGFDN